MSRRIFEIGAGHDLPPEAGGKAIGLQRILSCGLEVPSCWSVLPGVPEAGIEALVDELRSRGLTLLAVRSSAQDEDAPHASFAGIHETSLGVPAERLKKAIEEVAGSSLAARARAYRNEMGLPPASGPCAVVVQEMVEADCAGIAFGQGGTAVVIEAVEGIGDVAVEGKVSPESRILRKSDGAWAQERFTPRSQEVLTEIREEGATRLDLGECRHGEVLSREAAAEISAGVLRLQEAWGRRLDVEWARSDGRIRFLQARPQTRPLDEEIAPGQIWTRVNARDVLPEIPSALCRSAVPLALDPAEREFLRMYGLSTDPAVPMYTHVYGRPVFNEIGYLASDLLGQSRDTVQAELGGTMEADNSYRAGDLLKVLRRPAMMFRGTVISMTAEKKANRFIGRIREEKQAMEAIDIASMPGRGLLDRLTGPIKGLWREWALQSMLVLVAVSAAQIPLHWWLRRHPTPRALVAALVGEGEGSVSTLQTEDLIDLAGSFRRWSDSEAFTVEVLPDHASERFWREKLPADLWRQTGEWLERYGHRGPYESDIASPRYRDDLRLLARALFPLVRAERFESVEARRDARKIRADRAWREFTDTVGRPGIWFAGKAVRDLKRLMGLREQLRSEVVAMLPAVRRMWLELGRRFSAEGRLASREEIWHLSIDEIDRALSYQGFDPGIAVARERSRRAAWKRIEVPNRFTSEDVGAFRSRSSDRQKEVSFLQGNGISPGVIEGEVRVLMSPTDDAKFPSGAVLVAPATDPAWTPLFARAVGVVVELGGALSHAGIVAREFGIPCVANIDGLTRTLRDGDTVRIDGSRGEVTVMSRAG